MQAIITIDGKQWAVSVATTYAELASGLSGIASMLADTGILFDLGYDRSSIQIDMSQMLFSLDIIFINSSAGVVGVMHDVEPNEAAAFEATTLGARYFLEVNAGEAGDVSVGDGVHIEGAATSAPATDLIGAMATVGVMSVLVTGLTSGLLASGILASKPKPKEEKGLYFGKKSNPGNTTSYYWSVRVEQTGEIAERGQAYSSLARAVGGARAYIRSQVKGSWWVGEGTYTIRIYTSPPTERPFEEAFREKGVVQEVKVKGNGV